MMGSDSMAATASPGPSQTGSVIACAVVMFVLSTVAFGLRAYTRFFITHVASYEELLLGVALSLSLASSIGTIQQAQSGLGNHVWEVSEEAQMRLRMQQWYTFIFYGLSLAFTKMAILLLYMRILTVGYVRLASYVVLAAVVICNVWVLVSLLLQCIPLRAAWDSNVKGWCLPPELTGLMNSVLHVITDFAIFALPIPALSTLKMARNQKICVIALFGVGFLVCIISVVRIIYLRYVVDFVDATYGMSSMAIWGSVEVNMAIICACAATFKPLVNKWFPHAMDTSSAGMTQPSLVPIRTSTARQNTRNDMDGKDGSFVRLQELEHADAHSKSSISDLEHGFGSQGSRAPVLMLNRAGS